MYLLGLDIGSSSVKSSLIDAQTGKTLASAFYPKQEMKITAQKSGWAEQDPEIWWSNLKDGIKYVLKETQINPSDIKAIGISYQMHGLVCVDKNHKPLRSSIIWCDSRAVEIGNQAFQQIGDTKCLEHLLNSPGNFTASKLKWVKENEPELYRNIYKIMLPGDYINLKLTGEINTTVTGLSEGIFWDFKNNAIADFLLDYYGIQKDMIPTIVENFKEQGKITISAAEELGLAAGTPITYRAGDQPNNAFSLNVLNPGEIAATAGTSGVVYGVSSEIKYDSESRVNTFAHVNHKSTDNRLGILLCVNGTGILNSWLKHNIAGSGIDYNEMNEMANQVSVGSDGLVMLPFGNGAERLLGNQNPGCSVHGLSFNIHNKSHFFRAAQEGIVFGFNYGLEIMKSIGVKPNVIRAGNANMFLSPIFRETLAGISGATIELYDTDGAAGAAKAAGVGVGIYSSFNEAFASLKKMNVIEPNISMKNQYRDAYYRWKKQLDNLLITK